MDRPVARDWKDAIYGILLDNGFDPAAVEAAGAPRTGREGPRRPDAGARERRRPDIVNVGNWRRRRIYIPNARKLDSKLAEFYVLPGFLAPAECDGVTSVIKTSLRPSTIVESDGDPGFRTSRTCELERMRHPLIRDVDRRICSLLGIDGAYSEPIEGQYYEIGQEFKAHTDYFEGVDGAAHIDAGGQRTYTFMVYLNDVEAGGETEFARLGVTVRPRKGMAVIWSNVDDSGCVNHNTLHQAHPVRSGFKSIITKWFRDRHQGPMFVRDPGEYVRNFTKVGFTKDRLDRGLFEKILAFYRRNAKNGETEDENPYLRVRGSNGAASYMIELPDELRTEIHRSLKKPLEEWSGIGLSATFVYGIRVYTSGAELLPHRDRIATHIVSAIINVDQQVDEEWPLIIEDHSYRMHRVFLKPGEVLFYESARCLHGRPLPLKGDRFANVFCHFKPAAAGAN